MGRLLDQFLREAVQITGIAVNTGAELLEKGKSDLNRRFDEEAANRAIKKGEEIGTKLGEHLAAIFEVFEDSFQETEASPEPEAPSAPPPQATVATATPEAISATKAQPAKKRAAKAATRVATRKRKP